ncbi:hypothetical protein GCM10018793_29440 [Streptomyces sulfonofaciens]|uniref:Uncharacterized protein n=1 Tax=Streptomyces sulfonofaciens TaxID=68272 RepID=A0A919G5R6_9ACTN|nr:hypothetical protein GCM10018793_29440 [Streptomyces sulfonofaciens]
MLQLRPVWCVRHLPCPAGTQGHPRPGGTLRATGAFVYLRPPAYNGIRFSEASRADHVRSFCDRFGLFVGWENLPGPRSAGEESSEDNQWDDSSARTVCAARPMRI